MSASQLTYQINTLSLQRNLAPLPFSPPLYLDERPVMTKYSFLPMTLVPSLPVSSSSSSSLLAGRQIEIESTLRNQQYALQRSSQAIYVPSSTSDMYTQQPLTDSKLYRSPTESQLFFNATRVQALQQQC